MTTSESNFINDIKHLAGREMAAEARVKAAEARFRQLEHELSLRYRDQPDADLHVARELTDLRRAMLIELEKDPPATVGTLLDVLVRLTRKKV